MNIKHILLVALAALALGLASIMPGVSDGQGETSPVKDSATAWAVADSRGEMPSAPEPTVTTAGSAAGGVIGSRDKNEK